MRFLFVVAFEIIGGHILLARDHTSNSSACTLVMITHKLNRVTLLVLVLT